MATNAKIDLDVLATSIVGVFPKLDLFEQRLSLELYRLLAGGEPVPRSLLAERLGVRVERVNQVLGGWPGVFSDSLQRVVGYWGLSIPAAYASPHTLTVDGRRLSAWCAWDTLFLPQLLGKTSAVESTSPTLRTTVNLTVAPEGLEQVDPTDAQVSFLLPDPLAVQKDIVSTFCYFVHFFPSRDAVDDWIAQRPGTFRLSVADAHAVGRRKNQAQYGQVWSDR